MYYESTFASSSDSSSSSSSSSTATDARYPYLGSPDTAAFEEHGPHIPLRRHSLYPLPDPAALDPAPYRRSSSHFHYSQYPPPSFSPHEYRTPQQEYRSPPQEYRAQQQEYHAAPSDSFRPALEFHNTGPQIHPHHHQQQQQQQPAIIPAPNPAPDQFPEHHLTETHTIPAAELDEFFASVPVSPTSPTSSSSPPTFPLANSNTPSTTGRRAWICQRCGKSVRKQDRAAHMLAHQGKKRYDCRCGKRFGRPQDADRHIREQTPCRTCDGKMGRYGKDGRCSTCVLELEHGHGA